MKRPILYVHGGSGNHGCEAIVLSLSILFKKMGITNAIALSADVEEDLRYNLSQSIELLPIRPSYNHISVRFAYAYIMSKFFNKHIYLDILPSMFVIDKFNSNDVAFAIGGDTYSYSYTENNSFMHRLFLKKGIKTILWGCSINTELLEDQRIIQDLLGFECIIARESLTYEALLNKGVKNVKLIPDTAFLLPIGSVIMPSGLTDGNVVGINLSPLVISYEKSDGIVFSNYLRLIDFILKETDMSVALIPHVVWTHNDDRDPLKKLKDCYEKSSRVIMVDDHNASAMKCIISHCRFMVAARTHASIAAYSCCVPTLVVGYSIKSRGIAKDIFGTYEGFVLSTDDFMTDCSLLDRFKWLLDNEINIKNHLHSVMRDYINKAEIARDYIESILHS